MGERDQEAKAPKPVPEAEAGTSEASGREPLAEGEGTVRPDLALEPEPDPEPGPEPEPAEEEEVEEEEEVVEPEVFYVPPDAEPEDVDVDALLDERDELSDRVAALEEELEAAQSRLRTVSKGYRDLQEEMKQFRERMEQRAEAKLHMKTGKVVQDVFEPIQNLRRALENRGEDVEAFADGVQMIFGQFMEVLVKHGFEEVPGEGAPFDPNVHEALGVMPTLDPELDGKVLTVYNAGYLLGGKVLQAAQVIIGKYTEPAEA